MIEIGKRPTGEPTPLRAKPPPKPERRKPPEPDPPVSSDPPPPRKRSASRPDDDVPPFVTYRLDRLDKAVEKLDDDGTRVESKVDGLAVKVDDLAAAVKKRDDSDTGRKAFWSFMTVVVTVVGTMFANYMSKPSPVDDRPKTVILRSDFDEKLDECRKKHESVQDDCVARAYNDSRARK